jgi:hypothetical protein
VVVMFSLVCLCYAKVYIKGIQNYILYTKKVSRGSKKGAVIP